MEGLAFLLMVSCIVWLIVVCDKLPSRFVLSFNEQGKISEWGTPLHFIIVFIAGMLVYGGLSIVVRFKNMFGVSLFLDEYKGKTKYEATLLLFSLLKVYTLAMFLVVMYNMYARVMLREPADWLLFCIIGFIVFTIFVYTVAMVILYRKKRRYKNL